MPGEFVENEAHFPWFEEVPELGPTEAVAQVLAAHRRENVDYYAATRGVVTDPFKPHVTILTFPLDGLHVGKLTMFELTMEDR